jgi:hypothetical protein
MDYDFLHEWQIVEERVPITPLDIERDPEIGPELVRLQDLASDNIKDSPDWVKKLAEISSPLRAINSIHEAGHTFPYLSIYPDGGKAYATLSDNPRGEKSLKYPDSPKGDNVDVLWWNICAKMSGPAAESLAIGSQFDGCSFDLDLMMCQSIQRSFESKGIVIRNKEDGSVDLHIQRNFCFSMIKAIFSENTDFLYNIAKAFCIYDRVPLKKVMQDAYPDGLQIKLPYPNGSKGL